MTRPDLVIGLGGSGVQVVARLAAQRDAAIVGDAVEVRLLAIDEHDLDRQTPPLSSSATLREQQSLTPCNGAPR